MKGILRFFFNHGYLRFVMLTLIMKPAYVYTMSSIFKRKRYIVFSFLTRYLLKFHDMWFYYVFYEDMCRHF